MQTSIHKKLNAKKAVRTIKHFRFITFSNSSWKDRKFLKKIKWYNFLWFYRYSVMNITVFRDDIFHRCQSRIIMIFLKNSFHHMCDQIYWQINNSMHVSCVWKCVISKIFLFEGWVFKEYKIQNHIFCVTNKSFMCPNGIIPSSIFILSVNISNNDVFEIQKK